MSHIGRGERRAIKILKKKYPKIEIQVPITKLIPKEMLADLGEEYLKHRFDIVAHEEQTKLVFEVNYKHGVIAEKKWNNVYAPLLKKAKMIPLEINDYECRTLFRDDGDSLVAKDYVDMYNAITSSVQKWFDVKFHYLDT
jgi:hypothetical protein